MNGKASQINFNGLISIALLLSIMGLSACGGMNSWFSDNDSTVLTDDDQAVDEVVDENSSDNIQDFTSLDSLYDNNEENIAFNEIPSELDQKPTLVDLHFEQLGQGNNAVVADMGIASFYTLTKTAPSEYVLTIENAGITEEIERVILAPRENGKIRSVRAIQEGNNVALRIFSESDALLKVDAQGSKLMITAEMDMMAVNNNNNNNSEMMAQAQDVAKGIDSQEVDAIDDDAAIEFDELLGESQYTGRLISLDLQDTDIDNALKIIAEVSNLNIITSGDVAGKVTLRLNDVPWDQALDVILKTNGLDKVQEGNVIRIAPVDKLRIEREQLRQSMQAADELEPLKVQYIRVSYAKASELQPLVESVITERGAVAYDERTNQLIVKDISKGLKNVTALIQKLDLRTPQVLIETQIVEATRTFIRELGSELGFFYMRSPATGNATAYNFPNSIKIGGSANGVADGTASSFAAGDDSSAVSLLFGSADGTKGLDLRLSQAERESIARVVSRPSVAVTNNEPAVIRSVEKLRIRMPEGGNYIGVGNGATASGNNNATEVIEVGIVLNVTAQASPDYYVLMDIEAKSSTLGSMNEAVDGIPPEIERSANSTVLVSSGQTFALGGIYKISESDGISGVPWLKDIPVLGYLFRNQSVNDIDEELIFFITPRIIEGSFDDAAMKGIS